MPSPAGSRAPKSARRLFEMMGIDMATVRAVRAARAHA